MGVDAGGTKPRGFEPRLYRRQSEAEGLAGFQVAVGETDLWVQVGRGEGRAPEEEWLGAVRGVAEAAVREARQAIQTEGVLRPAFMTSLAPLEPRGTGRGVVGAMYAAGQAAGVGPMAAVAGAVAEFVARRVLEVAAEVLVENGGDLYVNSPRPRTVLVMAGRSALSGKLGLVIPGGEAVGVCTSSGTVGPSYSAGKADAALIAADDAAFADAMASALGNRVQGPQDAGVAVEWACGVAGVRQALVVVGETLAVGGEFEVA